MNLAYQPQRKYRLVAGREGVGFQRPRITTQYLGLWNISFVLFSLSGLEIWMWLHVFGFFFSLARLTAIGLSARGSCLVVLTA